MDPFGSHHRARTAPSSSSSDGTLALPLGLASHHCSKSRYHLTVPAWQPKLETKATTGQNLYKHDTPPAKRLRTRSTPVKRIALEVIPSHRHSKGPLVSDKTTNLTNVRSGEVGHFEHMYMDCDGGWDKEK